MARPTPVLPQVGSTIVPPGLSAPLCSAASIMRSAMRSFTEPPGLKYSTLARTVAWMPSVTLLSLTSGVLPTRLIIESWNCTVCLRVLRDGVASLWCGQPTAERDADVAHAVDDWPTVPCGATSGCTAYEEVAATLTSMSRARVARRIAAAAAYGGGGIGLLGAAAVGLVLAEVRLAKRQVGGGTAPYPPRADGRYGVGVRAPHRRAAAAAGHAGRLHGRRARACTGPGRPRARCWPPGWRRSRSGRWSCVNVALPGAQSDDLDRQVALVLADPAAAAGRLRDHDRRERRHAPDAADAVGAAAVGRGTPAAHGRRARWSSAPARTWARSSRSTSRCAGWPAGLSRQLAAAQTIAVVEQGGRTVSLGDLLGPEFEANPRELFGPDNYHPSAEGYATAAMAVLPTLCAALGLWPDDEDRPDALARRGLPAGGAGRGRGGRRRRGTEVAAARRAPLGAAQARGAGGGCRAPAEPAPDAAAPPTTDRAPHRPTGPRTRRSGERRRQRARRAGASSVRPVTSRRLSGSLEKRSASHARRR